MPNPPEQEPKLPTPADNPKEDSAPSLQEAQDQEVDRLKAIGFGLAAAGALGLGVAIAITANEMTRKRKIREPKERKTVLSRIKEAARNHRRK